MQSGPSLHLGRLIHGTSDDAVTGVQCSKYCMILFDLTSALQLLVVNVLLAFAYIVERTVVNYSYDMLLLHVTLHVTFAVFII